MTMKGAMPDSLATPARPGVGSHLERLVAAFDALDASSTHDSLPQFLHTGATLLCTVLDGDCAAFSRLDGNRLVDVVMFNPRGHLTADEIALVGDYPATRTVLATRVPAMAHVDDPTSDGAEVGLLQEFGLSSVLLLPIVCGPYTWGLAEAYRERPEALGGDDVSVARLFAAHLGSLLLRFYEL